MKPQDVRPELYFLRSNLVICVVCTSTAPETSGKFIQISLSHFKFVTLSSAEFIWQMRSTEFRLLTQSALGWTDRSRSKTFRSFKEQIHQSWSWWSALGKDLTLQSDKGIVNERCHVTHV